MTPGEILTDGPDLELNAGRPVTTLLVANTGDRPIQVGSHYHFFESNAALHFDRAAAAIASTSPPARRCASSRGRNARSNWWRWPVIASFTFTGAVMGPLDAKAAKQGTTKKALAKKTPKKTVKKASRK